MAVCPFCGARFADAPPRPEGGGSPAPGPVDAEGLPPPRHDSHLLQLPPAPMVIMGGAPAREARRRRRLWLALPVLALVALAVWGWSRRAVPFPVEGLEPVLAADPVLCGEAADCVVVFVAPWDEASAETVALLPALRAAWAEGGPALEVVVGAGERAPMERMARAVGGSTWIDAGDGVAAGLGLETVPAWFRLDGGRVVARVEGTFLPLGRQVQALGFDAAGLDDEGADERRVLTGEPPRAAEIPEDDAPGEDAP